MTYPTVNPKHPLELQGNFFADLPTILATSHSIISYIAEIARMMDKVIQIIHFEGFIHVFLRRSSRITIINFLLQSGQNDHNYFAVNEIHPLTN